MQASGGASGGDLGGAVLTGVRCGWMWSWGDGLVPVWAWLQRKEYPPCVVHRPVQGAVLSLPVREYTRSLENLGKYF